MDSIEKIIEQIENEIKISDDGKATFSIRAVARLGDKSVGGLSDSLKTGVRSKSDKLAEYLTAKGFEGVQLASWGESGIPDLAIPHILTYWAFVTDKRYQSVQAGLALGAFAAIGIRKWSQDIKGWSKKEQKYTKEDLVKLMLPETPKEWQRKYQPSFWQALKQTYGLERGQMGCSSFISTYVYKYFPDEVQERLKEINPLSDNGYTRINLNHQHFDHYLEDMLKKHIDIVTTKLIQAESKEHFKFLMDSVGKYKLSGLVKS